MGLRLYDAGTGREEEVGPMSKAIRSILFVLFVAIASYVAFGICGDWFQ